MKKILTAITATVILATGAFSTEKNNVYLINNLEQKACAKFKDIKNELLLSEEINSKRIERVVAGIYADAGVVAKLGGESSLEFLKGKNLGIKQNINFSTISVSYIQFLKFLYKNNSEEDLRKTALFLNLIESTTRKGFITNDIQDAYILSTNSFLQDLKKYKSFSTLSFLETFVTKNNSIDEKYNKISTEFLKTIIFRDFKKSIEIIRNFEDINELKNYAEKRCENVLKENYDEAVSNTNLFYHENKKLKHWTLK